MSIWEKLIDVAFQGAVQSIGRYREVKDRIARDLIFYDNAIMANDDAIVVPEMRQARQRANRESAADLEVTAKNLPGWYSRWLESRGEKPLEASKNLMGLSNATSREHADKYVANIKRLLRL